MIWAFVSGVLSVLAGLVFLLGNPLISAVALVIVLGCYLISSGITLVAAAFVIRRVGPAAPRLPSM